MERKPLSCLQRRGQFGYDLEKDAVKHLVFPDVTDFVAQLLNRDRLTPCARDLYSFLYEVQSGRGKGRRHLGEVNRKINRQMQTGEPLNFAVIAIAHKNPQEEICAGRRIPDLAELRFLLHLVDIMVLKIFIPLELLLQY